MFLPRALWLLLPTLGAACVGAITDPGDKQKDEPSSGPVSSKLCVDASTPNVGVAPLRRLTRLEYDNAIRDLLGDETAPARSFAPDEAVAGFDANSVAAVSKLQVEDYLAAAETVSLKAVATRLGDWVSCDIAQLSCAEPFLETMGRRIFRRPLDADEKATYLELYTSAKAQWGAETSIALVLQALLSSPSFLYLVERAKPGTSGAIVPVDPYTLAARLSFFLWSSVPDDTLLDAAASGTLDTPDGIADQARRLLADPRAEAAVAAFHEQWLELGDLEESTKDPELFAEWTPELAASMREETRRFASEVVLLGDAKLETLLTASHSYLDAPLAKLYGVPAPASAFAKVELDPTQRAGLLTQASVMTTHSGASETSWVHRGKLVRTRFLCEKIPPPPPGVDSNAAKDLGRLEDPNCQGCHRLMDPIGFGFDAYGPTGKYRLVDEHGETVVANGEIQNGLASIDVAGKFHGAVELAQQLAKSENVANCVSTQWFRFASRRFETEGDACTLAALEARFSASGHDVRELLVEMTTTHAFRYLNTSTP